MYLKISNMQTSYKGFKPERRCAEVLSAEANVLKLSLAIRRS